MDIQKILLIVSICICVLGIAYLLWIVFFHTPSTKDWRWGKVNIGKHEFRVRFADTNFLRMRGLSGTPELSEDEGMLFLFPYEGKHGFWMKGMLIPIDIVWISSDKKVIDVTERVSPEPGIIDAMLHVYYPKESAKWVLELPEGSVEKFHIVPGDTMRIFE